MSFIRSISGVRATLDVLTPSIIKEYSIAFSSMLGDGPIAVGRDGRQSGVAITDIVVDALRSCGRHVVLLDMVPTPTVQLYVEHSDAAGGICITASHNPAEWNGLKFIAGDGVFLDAEGNQKMWTRIDSAKTTSDTQSLAHGSTNEQLSSQVSSAPQSSQEFGGLTHIPHAAAGHVRRILEMPAVKGAPLARGTTVVVDAVNCSGSEAVPLLLEAFGYNVVRLFCDSSGVFPHTPEPISENLVQLCDAVREHNAAFGVAVDPDADRLVLIDEAGEPIGEELTIVLATEAVLSETVAGGEERGPVVVNYSTTRLVDEVAAKYGCLTHRAPVGEINVVRKMQQLHAIVGGEGSGGVIDPSVHYGRDSLVGIGLITSMLRTRGISLREAVDELSSFAMIKTKIALKASLETPNALTEAALTKAAASHRTTQLLERVAAGLHDAVISREDGVYASWSDRWVHVRMSNTEPLMRIIAEAPYQHDAAALIARVAALVEAENNA
ncbi:MAG: hypothetical protein SGJ05_01080 [bacterium]|nr:hypothetical protein [bacterium]